MTLTVVNQAEEAFLDLVLAVGYTLRLYRTDVLAGLTPDQVDALTESSFTEANFAGYSAAALTGGSWVTTQGNPSTGVYAEQTFTRSSTGTAQLIYGYYLTLTAGGALRWFEQFPAPVSIEFINDALKVTPRITLDDSEGADVRVGSLVPYGGTTAPLGWLLCNGAAVSRTTYADLFATIGTAYGVGDGSTTFNVPDVRQRFPLGKAASGTGSTLGGTGGAIDHAHPLDGAGAAALIDGQASGNISPQWRRKSGLSSWTATISSNAGLNAQAGSTSFTSATQLAGSTDVANPPFQTFNYIIKY